MATLEEFNTCNDENERLTRSLARSFETKAPASSPLSPSSTRPSSSGVKLSACGERERGEQNESSDGGTEHGGSTALALKVNWILTLQSVADPDDFIGRKLRPRSFEAMSWCCLAKLARVHEGDVTGH